MGCVVSGLFDAGKEIILGNAVLRGFGNHVDIVEVGWWVLAELTVITGPSTLSRPKRLVRRSSTGESGSNQFLLQRVDCFVAALFAMKA